MFTNNAYIVAYQICMCCTFGRVIMKIIIIITGDNGRDQLLSGGARRVTALREFAVPLE
jgi:hypothetical protein